MTVDIIFAAESVRAEAVSGKTAVVIDVLRASSVICSALANGAKNVYPVLSPEEAFMLRNSMNTKEVLLLGERNALPIDGFDFGNSPILFSKEAVKGKTLIMTTSNGTRAIRNAQSADYLYVASFLNCDAILNTLEKHNDIVVVCSGTNNEFALEDSLCAGLIACELGRREFRLSDAAIAMASLYSSHKDGLQDFASRGKHYQRLLKLGLHEDLDYCFKLNVVSNVPQLHIDGAIR
ncbi:MAG: 2-phosphosulfolactate phosphatase [Bacteroidales bacterium]